MTPEELAEREAIKAAEKQITADRKALLRVVDKAWRTVAQRQARLIKALECPGIVNGPKVLQEWQFFRKEDIRQLVADAEAAFTAALTTLQLFDQLHDRGHGQYQTLPVLPVSVDEVLATYAAEDAAWKAHDMPRYRQALDDARAMRLKLLDHLDTLRLPR